jgi:hypothetical protein
MEPRAVLRVSVIIKEQEFQARPLGRVQHGRFFKREA